MTATLRRFVSNVVDKDRSGERPLINLDAVGSGTGRMVPDVELPYSTAAQNLAAEAGDVLFAKLRPYLRKSFLATGPVFTSGEFLCLRPDASRVDPRWLLHVTQADPWIERSQASSYGSKMPRTSWDEMADLPLDPPSLMTQQRVADFLDDQVDRIDEIIRLRRKQSDALGDRFSTAMDESLIGRGWQQPATLEVEGRQLLPHGWRVAALSQVLRQLTNGYVGPTRDVLVDQGVRYVQSLHIKGGRIDFDRRHFFVTPEWHAARPRIHLREGDVLIVQTGDIGKVAVVSPDFGEASCHALQIARVRPEIVSGSYLGAYLGSSFGYHALLSRATGALHPHLEGGIRSIPVVIPPLAVQAELVSEVERTQGHIALLQAEMQAQVDLLQERKRSLITAAVTGEFDVSTASGRGVA